MQKQYTIVNIWICTFNLDSMQITESGSAHRQHVLGCLMHVATCQKASLRDMHGCSFQNVIRKDNKAQAKLLSRCADSHQKGLEDCMQFCQEGLQGIMYL